MSDKQVNLNVLLIEDDQENLDLLLEDLPKEISGHRIQWNPCNNFDQAIIKMDFSHYDLVATDVYMDSESPGKKSGHGKAAALQIINKIREKRFCPIIAFSSGSKPANFPDGPFVAFADKSAPDNKDIIEKIEYLIGTGIPAISRILHDELDHLAGSYLWEHLESSWDKLQDSGLNDINRLERIIRRRASIQLTRINPDCGPLFELSALEGAEIYIYPPVTGDQYRLGEIVSCKETSEFCIVLTPHCQLTIQPGKEKCRAEFVLMAETVNAKKLLSGLKWPKKESKLSAELSRRISFPAIGLEGGEGRFCFLPHFLEMPDLYVDLQRVFSLPYKDLVGNYEKFAVLDTPFAEALQACLSRYYATVGLPVFKHEPFADLIPPSEEPS